MYIHMHNTHVSGFSTCTHTERHQKIKISSE